MGSPEWDAVGQKETERLTLRCAGRDVLPGSAFQMLLQEQLTHNSFP